MILPVTHSPGLSMKVEAYGIYDSVLTEFRPTTLIPRAITSVSLVPLGLLPEMHRVAPSMCLLPEPVPKIQKASPLPYPVGAVQSRRSRGAVHACSSKQVIS